MINSFDFLGFFFIIGNDKLSHSLSGLLVDIHVKQGTAANRAGVMLNAAVATSCESQLRCSAFSKTIPFLPIRQSFDGIIGRNIGRTGKDRAFLVDSFGRLRFVVGLFK